MCGPATLMLVTTKTVTTTVEWTINRAYWQLPCGCINADYRSSEHVGEGHCMECGRGWMHADRCGGAWCKMLDGKPQGEPVLILQDKAA